MDVFELLSIFLFVNIQVFMGDDTLDTEVKFEIPDFIDQCTNYKVINVGDISTWKLMSKYKIIVCFLLLGNRIVYGHISQFDLFLINLSKCKISIFSHKAIVTFICFITK